MKKVYLDPGHGGADPGAVDGKGPGDVLYTEEEDVNLGIALAAKTALMRSGVAVKMSRVGDTYPTLVDRYTEANNWGATVYVSSHGNAAAPSARGIEILYHAGSESGLKLGNDIMNRLAPVSPWADRKVRVDTRGLAVLRATKMPAVLVEHGFLTNIEEEKLLADKAYQKKHGEAMAHGICDYLGVKFVAPGAVATPGKPKPPVTGTPPCEQTFMLVPKTRSKDCIAGITKIGQHANLMNCDTGRVILHVHHRKDLTDTVGLICNRNGGIILNVVPAVYGDTTVREVNPDSKKYIGTDTRR